MAFGLDSILSAVRNFLGPFAQLFDKLKNAYDQLVNIFGSAEKLTNSIVAEITAWRDFKQDVRFRQRVVQIESAIEKTRALIEGIPAAWRSIVDLVRQFKEQFSGTDNPIADAEEATAGIEEGGVAAILRRFPALARALEKVLGVLAIVVQALEAIANSIDDLQTIVDEITRLREEIEKLDTIFLSQGNKRKTLKLADGSSIRIRVGNLHS